MSWIIDTVYYVVPFIVLLGILVFVHELGHYLVAKISGVRVSAFSIGFGKELWGFTDKSGTHWKLSAVPLGGYCMFEGDSDASSSTNQKDLENLSEEDKKGLFAFQNPFKKLAIVLGGPGANYLFAILVFTCIFFFLGKFNFPPVVGEVISGSAAETVGIQSGDRILTINGKKVQHFDDIRREVDMITDGKAVVKVERGEATVTFKFPLKEIETKEGDGTVSKRAMLGVRSLNTVEVDYNKLSLWESFKEASVETWVITETTLRGIGQMITGKRSGEEVGGILRIAEMSGDISKQEGVLDFVVFMALLSINLGLINLFPIPVLDGGHVVIYMVEIITRREVNEKVKEWLFRIGLSLILALMLFATWNDIVRLFNRWFS